MSDNAWHNYLISQGAQINAGLVTTFSDSIQSTPPSEAQFAITSLIHYGLIRVSGKDAEVFLFNLLSTDVCSIGDDSSMFAAFLPF